MTPKSPQSPSQILGKSSQLNKLYKEAQDLLALQSVIRSQVMADVYVTACRDRSLHLITSSSATATRLRYRQRNIITQLRQQCHIDIDKLKVSVRPDETRKTAAPAQALPPSSENARQLADMAKYIEDEGLRKALIKLSKRGVKSDRP